MPERILVIGVGAEGPGSLPAALQARIAQADQLWGGQRLLSFWADHPAEKVAIGANIAGLVGQLSGRGEQRVVMLASGDPGFYGLVATLLRHLPPQELEIIPHVSSLQLAFARAGLAWNEAIFTSAHARPLAEVVGWAKRAAKLGILTDRQHSPATIAQTLLDIGLDDCRAIVAENLGQPDEQLTDTRLAALPGLEFGPLNVLLLVQDEGWQPWPIFAPRPDEAYAHRRGLITKADVRALSLARLAVTETDTIWDIGAGSGAVSVELAELAWRGQLFAIEHDAENLDYIRANCRRFGALNVTVVAGRAPAALADLPQPDAVFVGGSGGEMAGILQQLDRALRPGGRVVLNLATLENLNEAITLLKSLNWSLEVTQVNLAQGQAIAGLTRLAPLNPVFIVSGTVNK